MYGKHTFDTLRARSGLSESQIASIDIAEYYSQSGTLPDANGDEQRNILLTGPVGVGKTQIAMLILKEFMQNRTGYYVEWQTLFTIVQGAYNGGDSAGIIEQYKTCDVLLLDDLGVLGERFSKEDRVKIADLVLRHRLESDNLVTILTSNLSVNQMIGAFSETLAGRINNVCAVVEMTGNDLRMT